MIRRCAVGDAETLASIHSRVFSGALSWTASGFRSILSLPTTVGWTMGNPVVSFIVITHVLDEGEILTFATDPDHGQRGYGSALLSHTIHQMTAAKARSLFLDVSEHNTIARSFYTKWGFQEMGRRPNYYQNTDLIKDKAITLKLDLNKK